MEEAQSINDEMPAWTAGRIGESLNEVGKAVKGAEVLVLGLPDGEGEVVLLRPDHDVPLGGRMF